MRRFLGFRPGRLAGVELVTQGDVQAFVIVTHPHETWAGLCGRIRGRPVEDYAVSMVELAPFSRVKFPIDGDRCSAGSAVTDGHVRSRHAFDPVIGLYEHGLVVAALVVHRPGCAQFVLVKTDLVEGEGLKVTINHGLRGWRDGEITVVRILEPGVPLGPVPLDPGQTYRAVRARDEGLALRGQVAGDHVADQEHARVSGLRRERAQPRVAPLPRRLG